MRSQQTIHTSECFIRPWMQVYESRTEFFFIRDTSPDESWYIVDCSDETKNKIL